MKKMGIRFDKNLSIKEELYFKIKSKMDLLRR